MSAFARVRRAFERLLEGIVIALMVILSVEVLLGVLFRSIGHSLAWYDEVASILLAWLTYYGAALAALKRAHIGFPGLVRAMPMRWRVPATLFAEACVVGFFLLLGWVGVRVIEVLAGDRLVTLPSVSIAWAQSVIPISAALFIVAQALNWPIVFSEARRGTPVGGSGGEAETSH